LTQEAEPR